MTEENQKRRDFLKEIETIVHETLASQPADDAGCGKALDTFSKFDGKAMNLKTGK